MNTEETLKEVKKERQKVRKFLKESEQRVQELLWAMEPEDSSYGQKRKDSDEAMKIAQTLKCACKVISD